MDGQGGVFRPLSQGLAKAQYLTVQAASFQTALHRAGQKYKREYLGRSDMYRLGQVQVTLAKQREPGESF